MGVLGHAGAGKSTLVSVLTRGLSDNGRGLARMQVFRHNHEVFNGRTSSISQQGLVYFLFISACFSVCFSFFFFGLFFGLFFSVFRFSVSVFGLGSVVYWFGFEVRF